MPFPSKKLNTEPLTSDAPQVQDVLEGRLMVAPGKSAGLQYVHELVEVVDAGEGLFSTSVLHGRAALTGGGLSAWGLC